MAAPPSVLRNRSALHNCISSTSSSTRTGASVTFAVDPEATPEDNTKPGPAGAAIGLIDWVMERLRSGSGEGGGGFRVHAALAGAVVVVGCQLAVRDAGPTVHRACAVAVTVFSVSCGFCALALRLRRLWSNTSVCSLFATCCGVELALRHALRSAGDVNHHHDSATAAVPHTLLTVGVLTGASVVCVLSSLDVVDGALVVGLISTARYLTDTLLDDAVPCSLRPLFVYAGGLAGVLTARYIERSLSTDSGSEASSIQDRRYSERSPSQSVADNSSGSGTSSAVAMQDSPAAGGAANRTSGSSEMKRRRASASATNNYSSHTAARRISLPTLVHKSLVSSLLKFSAVASPGCDWGHESMRT